MTAQNVAEPVVPEQAAESLSTRERILKAARETFERHGTRGTTTREVAERAGVNEATIFRHFGNKIALLDEMRAWSCSGGLADILGQLSGDLETDLRAICFVMLQGIYRNRQMIKIGLAEEATNPDQLETPWRGPKQILDDFVDYLQQQVDAGTIGGNPRQLAVMIMGMMFTLAIRSEKLWKEDEWKPEAMIPAFVTVVLNGIKKK